MKINHKVYLATLAALGVAPGAFAAGVTPPWTSAPQQTLMISGSSAAVPILEAAAADVCVGKAWDEFRDVASAANQNAAGFKGSDQNYTAYYCTYDGSKSTVSSNGLGGQRVLVEKISAGGSVNGVNGVAQATYLANMDPVSGTSGQANGSSCVDVGPDPTNTTAEDYACVGTPKSQVPDAGISDVEPTLLQISGNFPTGTPYTAMTSSQISSALHTDFPFAQGFGIIVSQDVWDAGVTNLTKTQVAAALAGDYTDWSEISPNFSGGINVCFRVPGSGTRASAQAFFLDLGCKPTGSQPLAGGYFAGSGAGDVRKCMDGTEGSFEQGTPGDGHTSAIGILGLADGPNPGDAYHFVNIDGVEPSAANIETGAYQDYVESAMTKRAKAVVDSMGVNHPVLSGGQGGVYNVLLAELESPTVISTLPTVTGNPNLENALFSLNTASATSTVTGGAYQPTNPVVWSTKNHNTCQQPAPAYP